MELKIMNATIFMNKAKTITIVELDGQYFPFINVSGEKHDIFKLLQMIFGPVHHRGSVDFRTFSSCLSSAWRTARKDIVKQKALDKSWGNKNRNHNCGYPVFLHSLSFRVMDYIDAWNDEEKIWTIK